tara:strand:+ start:12211 stop:13035 length:825 start_codon:yes stop_codon:yes gene_type:complete
MGDSGYIANLNTKHSSIIKNLQELQAVETYLFEKIQESDGDSEEKNKSNITSFINNLSSTRTKLLESLKDLYTGANSEIDMNTQHLGDQSNMAMQLTSETQLAAIEEKKLIAEKNNKQRMAQIGEYEYSKNNEHKSVLKTIVYSSFFVLLIIFFNARGILPDFLTKIIIVIIVFIATLLLLQKLFWNFRRNNINYGKFNFPKKNETNDAIKENTFNMNKLLGLQCNDTSESYGTKEGFSVLNTNGCKSCKNIFPSNNLNNNTFKNTSLKFTTVN